MPGEHSGPAGGGSGSNADRPTSGDPLLNLINQGAPKHHKAPPKKKKSGKPDYGGLLQVPHPNDPFNNGGHAQSGGSTPQQLRENGGPRPGGGAPAQPAGRGEHSGNNVSFIVNYLRGKGLSNAQIAGALGNMDTESGFSPTSYNGGEGAIGLCQWEGGRRAALQAFAARRGTTETDLQTQLDFMWHEWHTTESYAFQQIMRQTTPAGAAAAWDQYYERSDGTTRGDRVAYAQHVFQNGLQVAGATSDRGGGSAGGSGMGGALTRSDYQQALGDMAGLLKAVPQLRDLLGQATSQGWSLSKFKQEVEQTDWYRNHNDNVRRLIALKYASPGEYNTEWANAQSQVLQQAQQVGLKLTNQEIHDLTWNSLAGGWDQTTLHQRVAGHLDKGDPLQGQYASYYNQLQTLYADYGVPIGQQSLDNRARQAVITNGANIDALKQNAMQTAASLYPGIANQLHTGMTVKDIADPFIQTMGNLLEINPHNLTIQSPMIKKALQGTTQHVNGKTITTPTTLTDFEQTVRSDPRWSKTQNAYDTTATALATIGRDWGFNV